MKKKAAAALTALIGVSALSIQCPAAMPEENRSLEQRDQPTLEEFITKIKRNTPFFTTSPVLATVFSDPTRVSEKEKKGFAETEFELPDGIKVGALIKITDAGAPYIISINGFLSDKESNASGNFIRVAQEYLQKYNVVILDDPTSSAFIKANEQPSFGGMEEGYILTKVAEQLKAKGAASIHLVGVSMSGNGVLHAAFRAKKGTIDSVISISGATDALDIPAASLQAVTPDGACGERYWNWSTINTAIGLHSLLLPLLDVLHASPQYKDASSANICDFFFKTKRYENEEYMKELYAPYIERKILPDRLPGSITEYLAQNNASLIAPYIEFPVFVIHAADDMAVSPAHYYDFMLAAKGNDFVQGMILPDGGHNGFTAAYGKKWEACVIKTDVEYWSAKKVIFDKECF